MGKTEETTYSDSSSATVHLYCAVEKRQISANWRTEIFIFFTVRLELLATCTFTEIVSPWWYSWAFQNDSKQMQTKAKPWNDNAPIKLLIHFQLFTSLSRLASKWILFGFIINSLLTSIDGCSPSFEGAYIIFRIAKRTEFRLCGLSSMWSPTNALSS